MAMAPPLQPDPNQEPDDEALLGKIKMRFDHVLQATQTVIPELEEYKKILENKRQNNTQPEDDARLEALRPKIKALAAKVDQYVANSKNMTTSFMTLPNGLTHIRYPYYNQVPDKWDIIKNPLNYGSLKLKQAAKEAAAQMGLKFESNFWGTKIKIRNQDGTALSPEQDKAYFANLKTALAKEGIQAQHIGKIGPDNDAKVGLTGQGSVGVAAAGGTSSVGVASLMPIATNEGATGQQAPASPAHSERSVGTEPGTPGST